MLWSKVFFQRLIIMIRTNDDILGLVIWGSCNLKRVAALNHQKVVTNHANLHSERVRKKTIWPFLVFEMSVWLFLYLELSNVGEKIGLLTFTESSSIEISISSVMLNNNGSYVNIHKLPKLNYLSGDSESEKGKWKQNFNYLQIIGHLGSKLFSRPTISETKKILHLDNFILSLFSL